MDIKTKEGADVLHRLLKEAHILVVTPRKTNWQLWASALTLFIEATPIW